MEGGSNLSFKRSFIFCYIKYKEKALMYPQHQSPIKAIKADD
jgi:hypothetical protein